MVQLRRIDPEVEAHCHVVLLHGLAGDATKTWGSETSFWPGWLASDAPAHIWMVDYQTSVSRWTGNTMAIHDRAVSLLAALDPELADGLPVVLIGHSLGGLLIKQMMKHSVIMGDQFAAFADRVAGVVFISSPHTGSGIATFATSLAAAVKPTKLVYELARAVPSLRENDDWFRNYVTARRLPALSFYETRPYKKLIIVDQSSGDPHLPYITAIPLDADHVSAAKFPARSHTGYVQTLRFTQRSATQAQPPMAITPAPTLAQLAAPESDEELQLAHRWQEEVDSDRDVGLVEPLLQAQSVVNRAASEGSETADLDLAVLLTAARAVLQAAEARRQRDIDAATEDAGDAVNLIALTPINADSSTQGIAERAYNNTRQHHDDELAARVHQVVAELVGNVVEHAAGEGYVAVSVDQDYGELGVAVGDFGVGLLANLEQRGAANDKEAILFAAEVGTTGMDGNRGAGLPWIIRTALDLDGVFYLASGGWSVTYSREGRQHAELIGANRLNGTFARLDLPLTADTLHESERPAPAAQQRRRIVELELPVLLAARHEAESLLGELGDLSNAAVVVDARKLLSGAISISMHFLHLLVRAGADEIRVVGAPTHFADHLSEAARRLNYRGKLSFED